MKNMVRWTFMLMVVVALVSPNVQAAWDLDAGLKFNMDFEIFNNTPIRTTEDSVSGIIGGVYDFNTGTPDCCNIFETNGKIGNDANFAQRFDVGTGAIGDCKIIVPNSVPSGGQFYGGDSNLATLGTPDMKRTWTLWFNPMKQKSNGTFLRHAYWNSGATNASNSWWELRLSGGAIQFTQKNDITAHGPSLDFQTIASVSNDVNTWHHVAVVIDRNVAGTTGADGLLSDCKIYVDGLVCPVRFNAYNGQWDASVDSLNESPLQIGKGQSEFDGRLDEIRLYHRALLAVEVSILKQSDGLDHPIALLPIPRSTNVSIVTDVNWIPTTGTCDSQRVWFGKDPNTWTVKKATGGSGLDKVTLADLNAGVPLDFNGLYYWRVDSNDGGTYVAGPNWTFTTGTGKAYEPDPAVGEEAVEGTSQISDINLAWKGLPTVQNYTVYASTDSSFTTFVQKKAGVAATISDGGASTVGEFNIVSPERNAIVYWRVDSNYASGLITGSTWYFRTRPYEIIFNTRPKAISYQGGTIGPNAVVVHGNGWFGLRADGNSTSHKTTEVNVLGKIEGTGSDRVLVFDFNTFKYDRRFDITVLPQYRASEVNATNPILPIAIHVHDNKAGPNEGCFKFDGRMNIAGMSFSVDADGTEDNLKARCGGYPGPKRNSGAIADATCPFSTPGTPAQLSSDYWTPYTMTSGNYTRFGTLQTTKPIHVPTALGYAVWGPGHPTNPPYKGGGGGGYGGIGGEAGRGYLSGTFSGGASYGDEEIPVPFGGSAGGWGGSGSPGGCAGGGGVEIIADANLTLDGNSVINANGGSNMKLSGYDYSNGGGAGGSVRLIANKVTLKGAITANGGHGGNALSGANEEDAGGGGAGGRVAVFYGAGGYSNSGTINVDGGVKGVQVNTNTSLSEDGQDGTLIETSGLPEKASAPTPSDKNKLVYVPVGGSTITLKWYAGYGAASDEVYFGTAANPALVATNKVGGGPITTPTRGQRSAGATVNVDPNKTYYFQVKTDRTDSNTISDSWTFSTVDWKCEYVSGATPHVKGPEWDSNGDCVLNDADLWYFAQYWRDRNRSTENTLDGSDLYRFLMFWLDCFNRSNYGCQRHLW